MPALAIQMTLDDLDMPVAMSITLFLRQFGQAISLTMAQAVFLGSLVPQMKALASNLTETDIVDSGTNNLKDLVQHMQFPDFVIAYAKSVGATSILAAVLAALGTILAGLIPWICIKKKDNKDEKDVVLPSAVNECDADTSSPVSPDHCAARHNDQDNKNSTLLSGTMECPV